MKLRAYTYTNRGGRDHNEDSLRAWTEGSRGIYVLADGLELGSLDGYAKEWDINGEQVKLAVKRV